MTGLAAGQQFANSNAAYVTSMVGMHMFSNLGIPAIVLLVVVAAIWLGTAPPLLGGVATVAMLCVLLAAPPAQAYYDKTDYTEAYTILPNEFRLLDSGCRRQQGQPGAIRIRSLSQVQQGCA